MSEPLDVEHVADELYALAPGAFVARRDALAAEAKSAGDRETASALRALRKPTVAAWLLNLLVREHRDEVEPFVELGEALREATAAMSGPELRELSAQRHRLVQSLVAQARRLGTDRGQRVGEDTLRSVEESLSAALADPSAAEALLTAQLTNPLPSHGFGPAEVLAAAPRTAPPSRARTTQAADPEKEARKAAAWAAAREAAEERDRLVAEERAAEAAVMAAKRDLEAAATEVTRVREELVGAEARLLAAGSAHQAADAARRELSVRRRAAEKAAEQARKGVDR